jgi:predicted ribosome quality control (RQC) complex YloA/Tae2 family protein
MEDLLLLKAGRHFRISEKAKAVVGRDKAENEFLERFKQGRWTFKVKDFRGPLVLAEGELSQDELRTVAALAARYSDGKGEAVLEVSCRHPDGREEIITTAPASDEQTDEWRL